jgi:riboflavin biosynthesis pyrimidine reductase
MSPVFDDVSWPREHPWWRANILIDHNGSTTGLDGTSASLTRGRDRELLRAVRADAQIVITGGRTVREEGWFLPPHGLLAVMSQSQKLPMHTCPDPERVRVAGSFGELLTIVDESQSSRVLCEGGPSLVRFLLEHKVLDELFVSVLSEEGDKHEEGASEEVARAAFALERHIFELVQVVADEGIAFTRFRHRRVSHN